MYKVKVISLKRRQDRREKMSNLFKHVPFEFVDALDGNSYSLGARSTSVAAEDYKQAHRLA